MLISRNTARSSLEHVVFFLTDTSEYKGIDTAELDEVAKTRPGARECPEGQIPIVTEPGPDVVRDSLRHYEP